MPPDGPAAAGSWIQNPGAGAFHPLLLRIRHRLGQAYLEHRRIFDAIATHDPEAAEREARSHIASATEIVLELMAQGERHGTVQA